MQAATTPGLTIESIDDYLGPASGRFFGSGYRRIEYRVDEQALAGATDVRGQLRARVAVGYPVDWSTKSTTPTLPPHLSTVDALILAARLGEVALSSGLGLDAAQRSDTWLRRVDIKAGSKPYEEGLDALPVDAVYSTTAPAEDAARAISVVEIRVSPMKVRCEFDSPRGGGSPASIIELIRWGRGPYGDGFRAQQQRIQRIALSPENLRADALVTVEPTLPSATAPIVTMVDAFVVSLQLGQVLLYELDGVPRSRSNTLWMRQTTMLAQSPHRASPGSPFPVRTTLSGARLLSAHGETWRTATIVSDLLGISTRCAVAHVLPEAVASPPLP